MVVYLIKKEGFDVYNNVIEWDETYVMYKAGKGTCIIRASEGEYFTDVEPVVEGE